MAHEVRERLNLCSGIYERQLGCVLVHGIEAELHSWRYDSSEELSLWGYEVVGDACACIYDEEGVVAVLCHGSHVGGVSVHSVCGWHACEGAGGVAMVDGEPRGWDGKVGEGGEEEWVASGDGRQAYVLHGVVGDEA